MTVQKLVAGLVTLGLVAILSLAAACESSGDMEILDVEPRMGHTQGEEPVRIIGQNFRQDIGYTVYFGTHKAGSVTILDPQTILVETPTRVAQGTVDITVRADDGHAFRIPEVFEFKEVAADEGDIEMKKTRGNLQY